MATGQQSFDPDDFIRRDREQDELRREQQRIDAMRAAQERSRERDEMQRREELASMRRMADVVNDPAIVIDSEMVKAINDPEIVMTDQGDIARVQRRGLGSGRFAAQFSTGMGFALPQQTSKKRRKKNPKLAAAFREANRRYRTKSGKLRKGRTQADIARLAHRLLKRM